jgi:hypothetical protein
MKITRSVYIECRKWFDRSGGNTYYSARLFVDGKHIYTTGRTYGYDNQYVYDVTRWMIDRGLLPYGFESRHLSFLKNYDVDVYFSETHTKKRDLWPAWVSEDVPAKIDQHYPTAVTA